MLTGVCFFFRTCQVAANALIKKGSLLIQKDLQEEALDCFARAVDLDPQNSDIYHHRGQVRIGWAQEAATLSGGGGEELCI